MSDERNPIIGQPDLIWNQMMERMKNEPLDLTPTTPVGKDTAQRLKLIGELGEAAARIRLLEQQLSTAREALEKTKHLLIDVGCGEDVDFIFTALRSMGGTR